MESYTYRMFLCFTRKYKINEAQPPPDVQEVFMKYTGSTAKGGAHMTATQLQQFLIEYQGEEDGPAESESERIVQLVNQKRHHVTSFFRKNNGLAIDDFFHYLFDDSLNGPINTEVHHDMTAPLQHYFIFTGHNSYLTGNQLNSDCSDVPIIRALQRGVRVIELDLWPNSTKDDINVLHGGTLTAPVPLIKCLRSIRDHAFEKSPYPVIITLEDHLTHELQAKVAKMVTDIFGERLYYPETEHLEEFPSPEELKHRIILSTKPPKEYLETQSISVKEEETSSTTNIKKDLPAEEGDDPATQASREEKEDDDKQLAEEGSESDDEKEEERTDVEGNYSRSSSELEYKRLIAIRAGKPKNGLRKALNGGLEKVSRLSLNEQALEKAAANFGTDVVRFTQKNFLRIYPKGSRVDSSNYSPMIAWTNGAQMVAFNMQGYGHLLWSMHGMFRGNGGCGYLKKPDFLMKNNKVFDPKAPMDVKTILKVRVYMGDGWRLDFSKTHFDRYSPPDFYTKLRVMGVEADCEKHQTRPIEDDWVPVWDEEFTFKLRVPELALLRLEVREYDMGEKDDFGGQTCLPVSEIKSGIRAVPLFDKKGDRLPSVRLLMRFQFVSPSKV